MKDKLVKLGEEVRKLAGSLSLIRRDNYTELLHKELLKNISEINFQLYSAEIKIEQLAQILAEGE